MLEPISWRKYCKKIGKIHNKALALESFYDDAAG